MKSAEQKINTKSLCDIIKSKYPTAVLEENEDITNIYIGDSCITINHIEKKYHIFGIQDVGRKNILNIDEANKENLSVVMLLCKLLDKGYSANNITLEKPFQVGHHPAFLDVYLSDSLSNTVYMIEVKSNEAINDYVSCKIPDNTKQVISYAFQDNETKIASYYTFNFDVLKDEFYNIYIDDTFSYAKDVDDYYDIWNQIFDTTDYINNNNVFAISVVAKQYTDLKEITPDDTKKIFQKFQNLLRVHSISDKPNAFMKFINLMICKICDEVAEDTAFNVKDIANNIHAVNGLQCQYISGMDTPESFCLRLNDLYRNGMKLYLNKTVLGYNNMDLNSIIKTGSINKLQEALSALSLKSENPFAFTEIYNEETFIENFVVLKDMVQLVENYKFKYDYKQQFLGDFFEELLNTSLKQEAGQFFTPMPLVDFILNSLPYKEDMLQSMLNNKLTVEMAIPKVIDFACGSGHFLASSMVKVQKVINEISENISDYKLTKAQKDSICLYSQEKHQYRWVTENNVVGIEKDYRLAKTTKITTYMNGDGRASILNADGINKFSSSEYAPCSELYCNSPQISKPSNCINKFSYVISNPPYSVDGFLKNVRKNNIKVGDGTFSVLTNEYNDKDSRIENLFVERAYQLLKPNGITAIILPQSILTSEKYADIRNFIFKYFEVKGMFLGADLSFSGTTTCPVIFFMRKLIVPNETLNLDYDTVIVMSPKYKETKGNKISEKEKHFLGYSFSKNRNCTGIKILNDAILPRLSKYIKSSFLNSNITIDNDDEKYVSYVKLKDIVLSHNENKGIFPSYDNKNNGKPLKEFVNINNRKLNEDGFDADRYIEISDIKNGTIGGESGTFKNLTTRICRAGDILLSSLNPTADKIIIADNDYMCSTAIHVLTVKDGYDRTQVLNKLRSDDIIKQMNSLVEGFKRSYAKISEFNLSNYVYIDL